MGNFRVKDWLDESSAEDCGDHRDPKTLFNRFDYTLNLLRLCCPTRHMGNLMGASNRGVVVAYRDCSRERRPEVKEIGIWESTTQKEK